MCQSVDSQTLASALETFRPLSLHEIESRLMALLSFLPPDQKRQRIASTLSVADQNITYAVKVRKNRTVELLPPSPEKAGTAGGRLYGYDRLLTVSGALLPIWAPLFSTLDMKELWLFCSFRTLNSIGSFLISF